MKKRPEIFFEHIYLAIKQIEKYVKNYDQKKFMNDEKTIDAVIRQLEIIGEAAGKLPKNMVKDSPIQWNFVTGIRHKLIHDYMGVDLSIVWETATNGIKDLKKYVSKKRDSQIISS